MPKLRKVDDMAVRALQGSCQAIHLPDLLLHRPLNRPQTLRFILAKPGP